MSSEFISFYKKNQSRLFLYWDWWSGDNELNFIPAPVWLRLRYWPGLIFPRRRDRWTIYIETSHHKIDFSLSNCVCVVSYIALFPSLLMSSFATVFRASRQIRPHSTRTVASGHLQKWQSVSCSFCRPALRWSQEPTSSLMVDSLRPLSGNEPLELLRFSRHSLRLETCNLKSQIIYSGTLTNIFIRCLMCIEMRILKFRWDDSVGDWFCFSSGKIIWLD